ncbi:MAG: PAS domain-containing protein [Sideroxyarcus sp.]|nr:PAS domain-containing protein [Sideroxyarcus sp.]
MDELLIINAFKNAGIALLVVSSEGFIIACNRAANQMFGHGDGGLSGRHVSELLSIASSEELNAYVAPPATENVIRGMTGRDKNGRPVVLSVHITVSTDPTYGTLHILNLRDIADELEVSRHANDELMLSNNAVQGARIGVFEYFPISNTVNTSVLSDGCELVSVCQQWQSVRPPEDRATPRERRRGSA